MVVPPYVEITEWTLPPINRPVSAEPAWDLHGLAGEDREMRVLLEQLGGRLV